MNVVSQDEAFAYVIATQLELTLCGWNFVSPMCYLFICYAGDLKLCGGTSVLEHVEPLSSGLEFMCMHDGLTELCMIYDL